MLDSCLNPLDTLQSRKAVIPFADLSVLPNVAKLSLRAKGRAIAQAGIAFGLKLPEEACRMAANQDLRAYWLGPDEWMLQAANMASAELYQRVSASMGHESHSLVDVSERSVAFSITGQKCEYVLNHGCALDLSLGKFPVGSCTRTLLGKATVILSREAADTFMIDVWRSFSPYVWMLLENARSEFV